MAEEQLDSILDGAQQGDDGEQVENTGADAFGQADEPQEPTEEEPTEETPPLAAEKAEDESWTKAAVMDERRKRQAAEKELDQLRGQQVSQDKVQVLQDRIQYSRDVMAKSHADFEKMETLFVQMANEHPPLAKMMADHPDPAGFAYQQAKLRQEYESMKDLDTYKATLRAEVKAEVLREMQLGRESLEAKEQAITPSLAKQRSSGPQGPVADQSLEDILGR